MKIEIISIILSSISIFIGIAGIIFSYYFWKHAWKSIQTLKEIKNIDFSQEYSMQKLNNLFDTLNDEDAKNLPPFQKVLYNAHQNIKKCYNENNNEGGND